MSEQPTVGPFVDYLKGLQDRIVAGLEAADGEATFLREEIATDGGGPFPASGPSRWPGD